MPMPCTDTTHKNQVSYSNWFVELFLRSTYENQWVIPEPLPAPIRSFLKWYERNCMSIDLANISIDRPIFIISLPRCGSSMLQDILCTHPQLTYTTNLMDISRNSSFCAAEHFRKKFGLNISGERFLKDSIVVDGSSPADPVATWADFFNEDYFGIREAAPKIEQLSKAQIENIHDTLKKVMWCFSKANPRFFCKTPMLLPYVGVLNQLFPDAKFIHLIRDPRQSANSMVKIHRICNEQLRAICERKKQPLPREPFVPYPRLPKLIDYLAEYGPEDLRTTANLWNDAVEVVDAHRSDLNNLIDVRYEDILDQPEDTLRKIFDFCELSQPESSNTAYHKKLEGIGVIHHRNEYHDFDVIEDICRETMQRFCYL